jgi:hypothetical protein
MRFAWAGRRCKGRGMRCLQLLFLLVFTTLFLAGCGEPKADLASPKSFRNEPVSFRMPGNWHVEEQMHESGVHHFSIETEGDAIVIVQVYPENMADDLKTLAKSFSEETAKAIPMGKMSGHVFSDLPEVEGWQGMKETLNMRLATVDIPHTRLYFSRTFGERRCFVICQVSTEDMDKVKSGFDLVRSSVVIE